MFTVNKFCPLLKGCSPCPAPRCRQHRALLQPRAASNSLKRKDISSTERKRVARGVIWGRGRAAEPVLCTAGERPGTGGCWMCRSHFLVSQQNAPVSPRLGKRGRGERKWERDGQSEGRGRGKGRGEGNGRGKGIPCPAPPAAPAAGPACPAEHRPQPRGDPETPRDPRPLPGRVRRGETAFPC